MGKAGQLTSLFITFMKIGAFTFGGGYAMIPLIQDEVLSHGWLTQEQLIDFIAVAESTPGPFAVNIATFVGTKTYGVLGAIATTLGVVLPSFGVILLISYVLRQFQQIPAVQYAFWGIRAGVLAMLIKSLYTMFKKSPKGWAAYVAMAAAFVLTTFVDVHILVIIIGCAVFGLITATMAQRREVK